MMARQKVILIKKLQRFIAQHREMWVLQFIARGCRRFLDYFENLDYDPWENGERFVLEAIAAGHDFQCIFDVGACTGSWALMANTVIPEAKIHCFEVSKSNLKRLRETTKSIKNIVVNDFGLSDRMAEVELRYFPEDPGLTTMIDFPHKQEFVRDKGFVRTGDSYVEEYSIDRIDFIKIDVEGVGERVLFGFDETISSGRVEVIQFEYGRDSILTHFLLRDYHNFFAERGYRVGKIYPLYIDFSDYDFFQEDFRGPNF